MTEEIHTGHVVETVQYSSSGYDRGTRTQRRFLFRPEVSQTDRRRAAGATWNGSIPRHSTIAWNNPTDDYVMRKTISGITVGGSLIFWFARWGSHEFTEDDYQTELHWEWGQIWTIQATWLAIMFIWAIWRTRQQRVQKKVVALYESGMVSVTQTTTSGSHETRGPAIIKAGKAIFDTRAYREGWVDKPKVRMIVEEEIWRINERREQLEALQGATLTETQQASAKHIQETLDQRMQALARYNNALLDIDRRLVEADLLKDQEARNGTLVNLLAELEGDQAIALTDSLTLEAKAVQQAIHRAIEQAKQAATEIHNLHKPIKEVSA